MKNEEVREPRRGKSLRLVLALLLVASLFSGVVYWFQVPIMLSLYRRTDIDDFQLYRQLMKFPDEAAEFWIREVLETPVNSIKGPGHALDVVSRMSDDRFVEVLEPLVSKYPAERFCYSLDQGKMSIASRYDRLVHLQPLIVEKFAEIRKSPRDPLLTAELYRQYFQLSKLKYLSECGLTPSRHYRIDSEPHRPKLDLYKIESLNAAYWHFLVDYGFMGEQRALLPEYDFGRELLIEFMEPGFRNSFTTKSAIASATTVNYVRAKTLNFQYVFRDSLKRRLLNDGSYGASRLAERYLVQSHWQDSNDYLKTLAATLTIETRDKLPSVLENCQRLGIESHTLINKLNSGYQYWIEKSEIQDCAFAQLSLPAAPASRMTDWFPHASYDPDVMSLIAMHKELHDQFLGMVESQAELFEGGEKSHGHYCSDRCTECAESFTSGLPTFILSQTNQLSSELNLEKAFGSPDNESNCISGYAAVTEGTGFEEGELLRRFVFFMNDREYNSIMCFGHRQGLGPIRVHLNSVLQCFRDSRRGSLLTKLFQYGSNDIRRAHILPAIKDENRRDRASVVMERVDRQVKAVLKSIPAFTELDRESRIAYLNHVLCPKSSLVCTQELTAFIESNRYFVKELLSDDSFARDVPFLVAFLFKSYSKEMLNHAVKLVQENSDDFDAEYFADFMLRATPFIKPKSWQECFPVLNAYWFDGYRNRIPHVFFELPTPERIQLFNALRKANKFFKQSFAALSQPEQAAYYASFVGDWNSFIDANVDNPECLRLIDSTLIFDYSNLPLKLDRDVSLRLLELSRKGRFRDQQSLLLSLVIANKFNDRELPYFGDLVARVFLSDDSPFLDTLCLVIAGDIRLKTLRAHCKSDADIIKFCRLCHELGPVALTEKEFLLKQLNHKRDRVVIAAMLALARIDWSATFMLETLTEIINDRYRSGYVRGAAICAMRRFEGNPKVGERLREFTSSGMLEPLLRDAAKRSLPVWEYYQKPVPSLLDWPENH